MNIRTVLFAAGSSAFFFDDQRAIKRGPHHDGFVYAGQPVTPGFTRIRMAGEAISVLLELDDGQIAVGDCVAVQYSGCGGRDPVFRAETILPVLERTVRPWLEGRAIGRFRDMAEACCRVEDDGHPLHTAVTSGVTQALLDERANACKKIRA